MPYFHNETKHSYLSIRKNAFFLDWQTQPESTKHYPHFYNRFKISDYEELKDLNLIGGITFEKEYPTGKYYLRTVPSAGALYPCEIYLQIKGVKGLISGIYHYEPYSASLCLLQECESDGVEHYFKDKSGKKGIIFLVSSIYFRSSWKYRDRSIRYILLDSGHQLGTIYAAMCVMGRDSNISFDFDKLALNDMFGFRSDEMFTTALFSSENGSKEAKPLKQKMPYVCGSDYLESNSFIEDAYSKSAVFGDEDINELPFFRDIPKEQLKAAILNRRSIRAFYQKSIEKKQFDFIVKDIFKFAEKYNIDIFYTVHRIEGLEKGLYKNGELLSSGDFSEKSRYLALEQNLGGHSAATFYFTSPEIEKYQKANILSGFIAQVIYIKSEMKEIGCSGIGAYYDDEAKEFLGTKNNILYLLAIGK